MNGDVKQQRGPRPSILESVYAKPLEALKLPFSNANLKKIQTISNLHSNFFQNIIFYTHNNFEISALGDTFAAEESEGLSEDLASLGPEPIQRIFLQTIAVYQVSQSLGLDIIDFSVFRLRPNYTIQLPVFLSQEKVPSLKSLLEIFTKNKYFKDLNEKNFLEIFDRLRNKTFFDESQAYIYRYDDFASNILNTYPIAEPESNTRIKIKINTGNHTQKAIIKLNFFNHHFSEDIFFADLSNPADNLPDSIAHLIALPGKKGTPGEDFVSTINRFDLFLKKSSFTSLVLMIDRLRTHQDGEFVNYLLEALGIANILMICFDTTCNVIDFDLELNEKPGNLLRKYLRFDEPDKKKTFTPEEVQLLKIFHTLPVSVPQEQLTTIFSPGQCAVIDNLIKKNVLKVGSGKIFFDGHLSYFNITITPTEKKRILESFLDTDVIDSLSVNIKYFLITRQMEELKTVLKNYRQKKGTVAETDFASIKTILLENSSFLETRKDIELMELLALLLVEENEPEAARKLIFDYADINPSIILKLQLAHIYKWEKEHPKIGQLLKEIEDEVGSKGKKSIFSTEDLNNQYHYLKFVYFEKVADIKQADQHLKMIKGERFNHRAAVLLSDRHIYRGGDEEAETLLNRAIDYFNHHKYPADEIEAKSQWAKLLREKQAFTDAEKLYQNLFIKSEMKNYRLISASIAVDLGNLYWLQDKFNPALAWYKKALKIFQDHNNQNGVSLTKSNLVLINKTKGNWQEAKKDLESILNYDKQKKATAAIAVDYFNIADLEYLKHHFTKAREFIETALPLFEKAKNLNHMIECEILKLKISLWVDYRNNIDPGFLKKHHDQLTEDQKQLVSIIEIFKTDRSNRKSNLIFKKSGCIHSKKLRFEIISIMALKYKTPELLELLKSLSSALSKEEKNYYYYEYFYIYYGYFFDKYEMDEDEKKRFNEVYYFFLGNQRRLAPTIIKYKHMLDEKDSQYDVFRSAELVGDYLHWKIPEDFFNSLVKELRKVVPVDLVKLVIHENKNHGNDPLFNFSWDISGTGAADTNPFDPLIQEMVAEVMIRLENLNLSLEEIKENYNSSERAFYFYKNTKVFSWIIADDLFGVLLLAFSKKEYYDYDFYQRHDELLKKFAPLINRYYQRDFKLNRQLDFIIGESSAIQQLKETILKVSKVDFPVLIRGESGSGKELVAKAVHLLSNRAGNHFVPVNAAAIPENLLEAELFGYKKGAFTGANENKTGLIEAANNGTLFLDEIADLPLNLQAKLLRVLQENEIRRLGENTTRKVNIRLICATNKNLKRMSQENQFREDLYFRIEVLTIDVPPLRKRLEDIPLLVRHFLKKYSFTAANEEELQRIIDYFKDKTWTGNVRELESAVKRLITYYPDFDSEPEMDSNPGEYPDIGLPEARDNLEKQMITRALEEHYWNKVDAANALKISRQYLFNLMKKHNIKFK
ncbi:MAG: sigma 54-interacting transcriptional regulator [Candidatus Aminicenantes bacterium]|jgi:DNA-binding NtrC family response regulator